MSQSTHDLSPPHTLCHRIYRVYRYHLYSCWYLSNIFHLSRIHRQQRILQHGYSMLVPLLLCKKMRKSNANLIFLFLLSFPKSKHTELHSRETWRDQFKPGFPRLCTVFKTSHGNWSQTWDEFKKRKAAFSRNILNFEFYAGWSS